MRYCGVTAPDDVPEPEHEIPCCLGEAVWGPERCTCWEAEYDLEQEELATETVVGARLAQCRDCAYLPGSQEDESGAMLPYGGQVFWCHQGMRKTVAWVHPDGRRVPVTDVDDYDPPFHGGVPYKADGEKADLCAGWACVFTERLSDG